jgi:hypothetical protein
MLFMEIAIAAIGIGVVLMVGFLVISNVKTAIPEPQVANPCLGENASAAGTCFGADVTSTLIDDAGFVEGVANVQTTVFAGFALIAVGIIVLAAFGLISIFK